MKPKRMKIDESTKLLSKKDVSQYDRYKLVELGVARELLDELDDKQAKELLKSMLYFMARKQDGFG